MPNILIAYSTTDGHTQKIGSHLVAAIEKAGNPVNLLDINDVDEAQLSEADTIVIGASIRYGKHSPDVFEFVSKHLSVLQAKPSAFFTVNVVARKADKNTPETNPYMIKFLEQVDWTPKQLGVFAGKIDYQKYRLRDRLMIRFIMWLTQGPTDPKACVEFTDWESVATFGEALNSLCQSSD